MQQKSRAIWLKEGDRNTAYFNNHILHRWNQNKILSLVDNSGNIISDPQAIPLMAVEHFQHLLGHPDPTDTSSLPSLSSSVSRVVPTSSYGFLENAVSATEVLNTLCSVKKNKAPGPDGFNANFFIHAWSIVGPD